MGLFSPRVVNAAAESRDLNNPSVPLTADGIMPLLGGGNMADSGVLVSEHTSMSVTAVWRCVSIIAGTIAQLPLKTYNRVIDPNGLRVETYHPALENPHPSMTQFEFWETMFTHCLLWGNAYALKVPNELGDTVVQLLPLQPYLVSALRTVRTDGRPGDKVYKLSDRIGGGVLTDAEIFHMPGLGYDGIKGLSPIQTIRQSIGLSIAAETFGAKLFGSGSLMGGVLLYDKRLDKAQAEGIKANWRDKITGIAKAHEIAVLDDGLKWQGISIPPEDSQFLQTRMFQVTDIARMFGVPPHLVGDLDKTSSWGAGVAEQSLGFFRYTLAPWLKRSEQRITMSLLPEDQFAEWTAEGILRGDTKARYASYSTALAAGWLNRAEVRALENMPPAPPDAGLDVYTTVAAPLSGAPTFTAPISPKED